MIKFVKGNMFEVATEAIVNPVNCVGVMGKGLALQFKERYPDNFEAYKKACEMNLLQIGSVFCVSFMENNEQRYIINFPTKRHYREQSYLLDIQLGLESLVDTIKKFNIKSIAIPALGCGLGGLNWYDVKESIIYHLKDLDEVDILVFEPY